MSLFGSFDIAVGVFVLASAVAFTIVSAYVRHLQRRG